MPDEAEITIHPTAVVCSEATLTGPITIKEGNIVHPKALLHAKCGPIIVGENNMIEENVVIENSNEDGSPLIIGEGNYFEVGSVVRASRIGSNNTFGMESVIGMKVIITDGCSIGTRCSVLKEGELPKCTSVFGPYNERRVYICPPTSHSTLFEVLRKIFRTYHQLHTTKRSTQSSA